jgi:hypothetical protein
MRSWAYKLIATAAMTAALAMAMMFGMSPASSEQAPTCQPVDLTIGSHSYTMKACNTKADNWIKSPPSGKKWDITVDGGLAKGSVLFAFQMPKATAATATPVTRIGWGVAKDDCLGVPRDHAVPGQLVTLMDCSGNPADPSEAWVMLNNRLRLAGHRLWASVASGGHIRLSHNAGPADWVYGPTHTIHIGKGWLTWCGQKPHQPYYSGTSQPKCQIWYAFTRVPDAR